MRYERVYLKKTVTEVEIRTRISEVVGDYADRLANATGEEDWGAACHYAGVLRGLKLTLGMATCYFENVESQSETDLAVRRVQMRGLR